VKPGKIVSNGAFRLMSWVPLKELILEKNPQHWDAATVKLQKVIFLPTDDTNTAYKQFLAGDSDWIPTVPPAQIDAARNRPDFYVTPYLGTYYFRFNVTKPPTNDGHRVVDAPVSPPDHPRATRPPRLKVLRDGSSDGATPSQIKAIYSIGRDHHAPEGAIDQRCRAVFGRLPAQLSKRQASEFIDLLRRPAVQAATPPVAQVATATPSQ